MKKLNKLNLRRISVRPLTTDHLATVQGGRYAVSNSSIIITAVTYCQTDESA
jgi:hypothetical protein